MPLKVSYLLASYSVINMVFCIPLAIDRDNFHIRSVFITSLRRKLMLCIGLWNYYVPISKAIASQYVRIIVHCLGCLMLMVIELTG
jgi:Na+/citrate or Na+/malate symporter